MTEIELNRQRIAEAKLKAKRIQEKTERLKRSGMQATSHVPSYHDGYFKQGQLLKKGYLDYYKK